MRLTEREYSALELAAAEGRLTLSDYVRTCVFLDQLIFGPERKQAKALIHTSLSEIVKRSIYDKRKGILEAIKIEE